MDTTETGVGPAGGDVPEPETTSKAQREFDARIASVVYSVDDEAAAKAIAASGGQPRWETITPAIAAVIYLKLNKHMNRKFNVRRAENFAAAMQRGEWEQNSMTIGFYPDGNLADGQHRLGAAAVSGTTLILLVVNDLSNNVTRTIDRNTRRQAAEGLAMDGIEDSRAKASLAKIVIEYTSEHDGHGKPSLTDHQIEDFVRDHDDGLLSKAVKLGEDSVQNISEPMVTVKVAQELAALALYGGASEPVIRQFLASVQQGIADYPEAPTLEVGRRLAKARSSRYNKDKLSRKLTIGMLLHSMQLWVDHKSVSKLSISKKALPNYRIAPHQAPVAEAAE